MAEAPEVTKVVFPENLERFKDNQDDYNDGRFARKGAQLRAATGAEIDAAIEGVDHG